MAVAEVAKVFADGGVDVYSLREYGRSADKLTFNVMRTLLAKILLATSCTLLLFCVLYVVSSKLPWEYLIPIGLLPGLQLGLNFFLNVALVRREVGWLLWPAILTYGLFFCGLLAVFLMGEPVRYVLGALVLLELSMLVVLAPKMRALLPSLPRPRNLLESRRWATSLILGALPVGLAAAIAIFYGRLDIFLIKARLGDYEVGLYAFASRLLDPGLQLINGWIATKGGYFAGLWTNAPEEFQARGLRLLARVLSVALIVVVLIAAASQTTLDTLFPAFSESGSVLTVLALALIPRIYNNTTTTLLIAAHQERFTPWISMVNLCSLMMFLLLLVPKFGLIGAAMSLLLAESLNSCMQSGLLWRGIKQRSHQGSADAS